MILSRSSSETMQSDMNIILRLERWLYIHFGISIWPWKEYREEQKKLIQEELDACAKTRLLYDSLED